MYKRQLYYLLTGRVPFEGRDKSVVLQRVRTGDWKLVRRPYGKDPAPELYNLKNDVGEANNVAGEYKDVVAKIEAYLKDARTEAKQWPVPPRKPQP